MKINQENKNGIEIFSIKGSVDLNTSEEFKTLINASLEKSQKKLILNLEDMDYITSEGIAIILQATKNFKRRNGNVVLCALQDFVKEIFKLVHVDEYLNIENNLETALKII